MKFKLLAASVAVALSQQAAAATYQLTELPRHDNSKYSYINRRQRSRRYYWSCF